MMTKTTRNILVLVLLLMSSFANVWAGQPSGKLSHNWYIGLRTGMPLGMSTFSSFGADKTRAGFTGGLYGGYRFNSLLSLETSAAWGSVGMSADNGCGNYWLGSDLNRYYSPVMGMQGWNYSDLYSSVCLQQYGVHLNVNVLGFFSATKDSRWSVNVSPALYGVATKATVKSIDTKETAVSGNSTWHLGVGGDVMAEYAVTQNLSVGLYTGITHLTGSKMDGMPNNVHKTNMTWESGVRIGWRFGKEKSRKASPAPTTIQKVIETKPTVTEPVAVAPIVEVEVQKPIDDKNQEQQKVEIKSDMKQRTVELPVIYFAFNSWTIELSQHEAVAGLVELMQVNEQLKITVTGYTDMMGSEQINQRIAFERAEAVKKQLIRGGIAADRIITKAYGVDKAAQEPAKARRAETKEQEVR